MSQSVEGSDITEMMHRLKTRLALANFKRQYGYEKYDLQTLEINLFQSTEPRRKKSKKKEDNNIIPNYYRRYYPNNNEEEEEQQQQLYADEINNASLSPPIRATRSTPLYSIQSPLSAKRSTSPRYRHHQQQQQQHYQSIKKSSSTSTTNSTTPLLSRDHSINNSSNETALLFSSDEEDAANLLVMLHNHPHSPSSTVI
ncbi:hypothetical protein BDC45DRAFT_533415 [Circinella umbellata]|nr:hypothetical protein BDC45DRAFT_533415 [Circinella umbellata]